MVSRGTDESGKADLVFISICSFNSVVSHIHEPRDDMHQHGTIDVDRFIERCDGKEVWRGSILNSYRLTCELHTRPCYT